MFYSDPNRIVLFYNDAEISAEYTKIGTFDATEEFVTAVEETLQLITAAAKLRIITFVCRDVAFCPSTPRLRKLRVKQFLQCLCRFLP